MAEVECSNAEFQAFMREREAAAVKQFVKDSQARVRDSTGYYSVIRFQLICGPLVAGFYQLTMSRKERQAFAYKLGDEPGIAGFEQPAGLVGGNIVATLAQTNLDTAKNTRSGETFIITGISSIILPGSDYELAKWLWQHCYVELVKNSKDREPLGPLSFFPALSSINGEGDSYNERPSPTVNKASAKALRGSEGTRERFDLSASPVIWQPQGNKDSSLYLAVNMDEQYIASVAHRNADPLVGPVEAWDPVASLNSPPLGPGGTPRAPVFGSFVDVLFRFDGTSESVMSVNQLAGRHEGPAFPA